jgi:hypothetical protein
LRLCGYRLCEQEFKPKTHNQKYCNDECCRLETNAVVMDRYYERKSRLGATKRNCAKHGCPTVLSRYNPGLYCGAHDTEQFSVSAIMEGIL